MEIGNRLKEARQKSNYTQDDVAKLLGVSRQSVSSWENNRAYPELSYVIKMSELYHLSLDELLRDQSAYVSFVKKSTHKPKIKITFTMVLEIVIFLLIWGGFYLNFYFTYRLPYPKGIPFSEDPKTLGYDIIVYVFCLPPIIFLTSGFIGADPGWKRAKWFLIPLFAFSGQILMILTFGYKDSLFGHNFIDIFISLTLPESILSLGGMLVGTLIGRAITRRNHRGTVS